MVIRVNTQRQRGHRENPLPLCVLCASVFLILARELKERIAGNVAKLLEAAT